MAKKIRFPLEMENQVEVRSMEELREHFSLSKVLEYVKNGKLEIWLRDRYENELVGKVAELDKEDEELPKKVSEIFEVPYDESLEEDLRKAEERAERIKKLKEFTDEEGFLSEMGKVAFDQDELYDLLNKEVKEIYLFGDRFNIPLSVEGVTYRGIHEPVVTIDSSELVDWDTKEIRLENVIFDEKYQNLIERKKAISEIYEMAEREILRKNFYKKDITRRMREQVYDSRLIGMLDGTNRYKLNRRLFFTLSSKNIK